MARSTQIKLSDVATSRVNNLNFIRFVAALMVIVSHCYSVVLGGDAGSYLLKLTGDRLSPGGVSVGIFFLFGGFLIARSCEHYPEAKKVLLGTHFEAFSRASICCYFDCVCAWSNAFNAFTCGVFY